MACAGGAVILEAQQLVLGHGQDIPVDPGNALDLLAVPPARAELCSRNGRRRLRRFPPGLAGVQELRDSGDRLSRQRLSGSRTLALDG